MNGTLIVVCVAECQYLIVSVFFCDCACIHMHIHSDMLVIIDEDIVAMHRQSLHSVLQAAWSKIRTRLYTLV
jgi:hypothetical protein